MKISILKIKRELLELVGSLDGIAEIDNNNDLTGETLLKENTVKDLIEEYFNKLKMDMKR